MTTEVRRPDEWHNTIECDEYECVAVADPQTDEEIARAYEHWRWHSYLSGCSHGN